LLAGGKKKKKAIGPDRNRGGQKGTDDTKRAPKEAKPANCRKEKKEEVQPEKESIKRGGWEAAAQGVKKKGVMTSRKAQGGGL